MSIKGVSFGLKFRLSSFCLCASVQV